MDGHEQRGDGLALSLHGALRSMVETLAEWQGLAPADVVRKAITDEYVLQDTLRRGGKILVETAQKQLYTVTFHS